MSGAFDPTVRLGTPHLGRAPRRRRSSAIGRTAQPALRRELAVLGPVGQLRAGRLTRRLTQLVVGLVLYGVTMAMVVRATLGNDPWDVLHQGMARHLPISFGTAVIVMSGVVLLGWVPLRQLPGVGTVLNSVLIGLSADFFLGVLGEPGSVEGKLSMMSAGVFLNGVATALYIGSQLGPGPRDGLMTGLHRSTGLSIRLVRTSMEVSVVAVGWLLGGMVGIGTIVYAVAIGPLVQWLLPLAIVELPELRERPEPVGTRTPDPDSPVEPVAA